MRISPISYNTCKPKFRANYSKENNVAILGSSRLTPSIMPEVSKASEIVQCVVLSNKNVLTGCGNRGIMGQAYYTAAELSTKNKDGKPFILTEYTKKGIIMLRMSVKKRRWMIKCQKE